MISGRVTVNREAMIKLEVVGPARQSQGIDAVIDTGFNGYVTLPRNLIDSLNIDELS